MGNKSCDEKLYQELNTDKYKKLPYKYSYLGEGMGVIDETMWGWWKHRYLVNHNTKCAYEFMDKNQRLCTVTEDDIDWESLKGLSVKVQGRARALSFHFPSFILGFRNGVAEVCWQINPDGRYYMDEDGYGMTDDVEIEYSARSRSCLCYCLRGVRHTASRPMNWAKSRLVLTGRWKMAG